MGATLPISQDILGWHGPANARRPDAVAAPPALTARASGRARDGWRQVRRPRAMLLGLAATHRLSLLVGLAVLSAWRALVALTSTTAPPGAARLAGDLRGRRRSRARRGRRSTTSWSVDAPSAAPAGYDGLPVDEGGPGAAVARTSRCRSRARGDRRRGLALRWVRRDRALTPALCLLARDRRARLLLARALPARLLPDGLLPAARPRAARGGRARAAAAPAPGPAVAGALLAVTARLRLGPGRQRARLLLLHGRRLAARPRRAAAPAEPGEVVVTDRCWSFLGTWLLHTRTLPALSPRTSSPRPSCAARARPGPSSGERRQAPLGPAAGGPLPRWWTPPAATPSSGRSLRRGWGGPCSSVSDSPC